MTERTLTLVNKISLVIIVCFFALLFWMMGVSLWASGFHINCDANGYCSSYYHHSTTLKRKDESVFTLNNTSRISCMNVPQIRKNRYHLFVNTDGNNIELQPQSYLILKDCNLYKSVLENNIHKSDKTLKYRRYSDFFINLIYLIVMLLTLVPMFLPLKFFIKPININKKIINPWICIMCSFLYCYCYGYIVWFFKDYEIKAMLFSLTSTSFFVLYMISFYINASLITKARNFVKNYAQDYPNKAGFADRLVAWNLMHFGVIYFTNTEIILVQTSFKELDLETVVISLNDIKEIKKSLNRRISIITSDKKYNIVPPSTIKVDIFIDWMNETIEKIRTEK